MITSGPNRDGDSCTPARIRETHEFARFGEVRDGVESAGIGWAASRNGPALKALPWWVCGAMPWGGTDRAEGSFLHIVGSLEGIRLEDERRMS
jgi:hypothetical protein